MNLLFLFALALVWLSVTGVISWWTRRPARSLAPPPRTTAKPPRYLWPTMIVICVPFPILGLSMALVFLVELVLGRGLGGAPGELTTQTNGSI